MVYSGLGSWTVFCGSRCYPGDGETSEGTLTSEMQEGRTNHCQEHQKGVSGKGYLEQVKAKRMKRKTGGFIRADICIFVHDSCW